MAAKRETGSWPLLPTPDDGVLRFTTGSESIRECIEAVLLTSPGERLGRPELGAGLPKFVHQPNTLLTRTRMVEAVRRSLALWEPRIIVTNVEAEEARDDPERVRLVIEYHRRTDGGVDRLSLLVDARGS